MGLAWRHRIVSSSEEQKKNNLECTVLKYFQNQNPHSSSQTQFNQKSRKGFGVFFVDDFCSHCNTVLGVLGCYWHFCPFQEKKGLPIDEIQKSVKMSYFWEYDKCGRKFLLKCGFKVCEIWERHWWKNVKNKLDGVGDYMKTIYPSQKQTLENKLIGNIKSGWRFGVVDYTTEVPKRLSEKFSEFPVFFKNCAVSLEDIGPHMKNFAHEKFLMKKPIKMLISSFCLQGGPVITPLLQFCLKKRLVLDQFYWAIQYTPRNISSFSPTRSWRLDEKETKTYLPQLLLTQWN